MQFIIRFIKLVHELTVKADEKDVYRERRIQEWIH